MSAELDDHEVGTAFWEHMWAWSTERAAAHEDPFIAGERWQDAVYAGLALRRWDRAGAAWDRMVASRWALARSEPEQRGPFSLVDAWLGGADRSTLDGWVDALGWSGVVEAALEVEHPRLAVAAALALGADDAARAAAERYEEAHPGGRSRQDIGLPGFGQAAIAVLDADAAEVAALLDRMAKALLQASKKGHRRSSPAVTAPLELWVVWVAGRDRGVHPAPSEALHRAVVPLTVLEDLELHGQSIFRRPFTWEVDLVPAAFLGDLREGRYRGAELPD